MLSQLSSNKLYIDNDDDEDMSAILRSSARLASRLDIELLIMS